MSYNKEQDKIMYIIGCITTILFACAAILFYTKRGLLQRVMPPCAFYKIVGFYCPGCGGTRAVYALFQGHLLQSILYQPFILYTTVVGGWFIFSQSIERISHGKYPIGMHFRMIWVYIGIGLILANCIIKNLILHFWGIAII